MAHPEVISGKDLDHFAAALDIERRRLSGPWHVRIWRWLFSLPVPLEDDASLRARCLDAFRLPVRP